MIQSIFARRTHVVKIPVEQTNLLFGLRTYRMVVQERLLEIETN